MGIVESAIEEELEYDSKSLRSRLRTRAISDARFIWAKETYIAVPDITSHVAGSLICRNHDTILHYLKRYNDLYETDSAFRAKADRISASIRKKRSPRQTHSKHMWMCFESNGAPIWRSISESRSGAEQWAFEDFSREVKSIETKIIL